MFNLWAVSAWLFTIFSIHYTVNFIFKILTLLSNNKLLIFNPTYFIRLSGQFEASWFANIKTWKDKQWICMRCKTTKYVYHIVYCGKSTQTLVQSANSHKMDHYVNVEYIQFWYLASRLWPCHSPLHVLTSLCGVTEWGVNLGSDVVLYQHHSHSRSSLPYGEWQSKKWI